VAQEAMQALAQNWRREMGVVVSDMSSVIPGGESPSVGQYQGHPANQGLFRELSGYRRRDRLQSRRAKGKERNRGRE
jgi:hypothetical protein